MKVLDNNLKTLKRARWGTSIAFLVYKTIITQILIESTTRRQEMKFSSLTPSCTFNTNNFDDLITKIVLVDYMYV